MSVKNSRREFFGIAAATVASAGLFCKESHRQVRRRRAGIARRHPGAQGKLAQVAGVAPNLGTIHPGGAAQRPMYRGSGEQVPQFEVAYAKLLGPNAAWLPPVEPPPLSWACMFSTLTPGRGHCLAIHFHRSYKHPDQQGLAGSC